MARSEWLRTFVAVYRAGSVSEGARQRSLSQPAASQQLAGLERSIGAPLFVRSPAGMTPTARGRELYGEVAEPLDRLQAVLAGLDAGRVRSGRDVVRLGTTAEYFAAVVVPRLAAAGVRVTAQFGPDPVLLELLERGDLDVTVTATPPSRRVAAAEQVGERRFVLVGAPGRRPPPAARRRIESLADWLSAQPWVSYSAELPVTRRFWQGVLGRGFAAELRLVAPDLRAVLSAVEHDIGVSLLPAFVCAEALRAGRVVELHPVGDLVPAEPLFAAARLGELVRPEVGSVLAALHPD
jgi:DNA-binding transcriptional LysR family regulator